MNRIANLSGEVLSDLLENLMALAGSPIKKGRQNIAQTQIRIQFLGGLQVSEKGFQAFH